MADLDDDNGACIRALLGPPPSLLSAATAGDDDDDDDRASATYSYDDIDESALFRPLSECAESTDGGDADDDDGDAATTVRSGHAAALFRRLNTQTDASRFVGAVMGSDDDDDDAESKRPRTRRRKRRRVVAADDDEDNISTADESADNCSGKRSRSDAAEERRQEAAEEKRAAMAKLTHSEHVVTPLQLRDIATTLGDVGRAQTDLKPLDGFPVALQTNRSHKDCEICRVGDIGRTAHSGVLASVHAIFEVYIGATTIDNIYQMMTEKYNEYIRRHNTQSRLHQLRQPLYVEWSIEMVRRHYNEHEVNHLKIAHDTITTLADKMNFTHNKMTYYQQTRGGEVLTRHDAREVKLWMSQSKLLMDLLKQFNHIKADVLRNSVHLNGGGGGGGGGGGKSTAMSGLTQNSSGRGATGFTRR